MTSRPASHGLRLEVVGEEGRHKAVRTHRVSGAPSTQRQALFDQQHTVGTGRLQRPRIVAQRTECHLDELGAGDRQLRLIHDTDRREILRCEGRSCDQRSENERMGNQTHRGSPSFEGSRTSLPLLPSTRQPLDRG